MDKREINIAKQAVQEDLLEKLQKELMEPLFTIRDTEVKHRNITHWDKQGLLIGQFPEGKWRRFNYVEILWLRMIALLRSFEIPLELINKLKSGLCDDSISAWEIFQDGKAHEVIETLAKADENLLPDKLPAEVIEAMKTLKISPLLMILTDAILFRNHWMILVNQMGDFTLLKLGALDEFLGNPQQLEFIKTSFVAISLTEVISESIKKIDVEILSRKISVLTIKEADILKRIRTGGLSSLKITFNKEDEIELVEETRKTKLDLAARFSDILWSKGYQTITAKTQDGVVTHFEISTRFKLT
jgi:DNA-binding transcriptional MerR regulator